MSELELIKKLRESTGAGVMDVKEALAESGGDEQKAMDWLRKKGQKIADKRAERATSEGFIGSYVHSNGKIGSMVGVGCETDFVGRNEDFRAFAKDLALHVAATAPQYLHPEDVPAEIIEKEKEVYKEQLAKEGKPENVMEKILEGKIQKYYEENCLMKQKFVKDDSKTIEQLLTETIAKIGENIKITNFVYFTL